MSFNNTGSTGTEPDSGPTKQVQAAGDENQPPAPAGSTAATKTTTKTTTTTTTVADGAPDGESTTAAAAAAIDCDSTSERIVVGIRMRPLSQNAGQRAWKVLPQQNSIAEVPPPLAPLVKVVVGRNYFTFDKTFSEDVSTQQVYDSVAKNIVASAVSGLNGTIFVYGQTSSGKTFTMQGVETIAPHGGGGIVQMAAADIFRLIRKEPNRDFSVHVSAYEIYKEEVRDLLAPDTKVLAIREDCRKGVFVQSEEQVASDLESLLNILVTSQKLRTSAATKMNERSSRSHSIFRITIKSRAKSTPRGAVRIATLNLVDLAGSESVRHTGAQSERQKEGGMIDQSLLSLSRVIFALGTTNQTQINFRDSTLTRILQPSLSGNARVAVICCVTPSAQYAEVTRSTLAFASRAKLVKTCAKVNEVLDDRSLLIRQLHRDLAKARRDGAAQAEHVRALEEQAETAVMEAEIAQQEHQRLQSCIDALVSQRDSANERNAELLAQRDSANERNAELLAQELQGADLSRQVDQLTQQVEEGQREFRIMEENLTSQLQSAKQSLALANEDSERKMQQRIQEVESVSQERMNRVSDELESTKTRPESADRQSSVDKQKILDLEEALKTVTTELSEANRCRSDFWNAFDTKQDETDELVAAQKETMEELQGLKSKLKDAEIALASSESAHETNRKVAIARCDQLAESNRQLQSDLDESTNVVRTLTQERDTAIAQITRLGCALAEKSNELESLQASQENLHSDRLRAERFKKKYLQINKELLQAQSLLDKSKKHEVNLSRQVDQLTQQVEEGKQEFRIMEENLTSQLQSAEQSLALAKEDKERLCSEMEQRIQKDESASQECLLHFKRVSDELGELREVVATYEEIGCLPESFFDDVGTPTPEKTPTSSDDGTTVALPVDGSGIGSLEGGIGSDELKLDQDTSGEWAFDDSLGAFEQLAVEELIQEWDHGGTETLDPLTEVEEEETEDNDQEKSDSDDGQDDTSTGVSQSETTVAVGDENPTPVASGWLESIQDRRDEFLNALQAEEISEAARVALLLEIGAYENEQDFVKSKQDSLNLLRTWAEASAELRPFCILDKTLLLKKAKSLGIKGVHVGWNAKTIIEKIIKQASEGRSETG